MNSEKTNNERIRETLKAQRIFQWEIGEKLGQREETVCRTLRKPLTPENGKIHGGKRRF